MVEGFKEPPHTQVRAVLLSPRTKPCPQMYIFLSMLQKKNGIDLRKISRRDYLFSISIIYLFNKIYNTYPTTTIGRGLKPLNIRTDPRTRFNWWRKKNLLCLKKHISNTSNTILFRIQRLYLHTFLHYLNFSKI
jgi:hypothetical protein